MLEQAVTTKKPKLSEMPAQRMAVVETVGDPNAQQEALSALYGSVYTLKFQRKAAGKDFKLGAPRARWPDAHLVPREQWHAQWALPVPPDVTELPQKDPAREVRLEDWGYGTVAEILHLGPYSTEGPSIQALHDFIQESGYEIAGTHEEEYLTSPRAKVQKTLIRYPVRKRAE